MSARTSRSNSIPVGYSIVQRYPRITGDGDDVSSALEALKASVANQYPEANWILGINFAEIEDVECSATGYPYKLQKNQ
jgi:hypothetical protein